MNIFKIFSRIKSSFKLHKNRKVHSYLYKMNKAYMRCPEGSDVFEISFLYDNPNLKVNREFNFCRKLEEPVSNFLSRVLTNIEKIVNKKNKRLENTDSDTSMKIALYQNGNEVSGETLCKDLFNTAGDIRLRFTDREYKVLINTPWIKTLSLPRIMLVNFPIYPDKLETLFFDKMLSQFTWYKSEDKKKWKLVGKNFVYYPTTDDIDCYLKISCTPKNSTQIGPTAEAISMEKVVIGPGLCPFDTRHNFTKQKLSGKKVVTYNILADLYCDSEYSRSVLFPYCPPYALKIDYRKQLILKEIIGYNADIICLQEVDDKIYENDLVPVLTTINYEGIFNKKGGNIREGLVCFYEKSRFRLLESMCIILAEDIAQNPLLQNLWEKISSNENLVKRLTERNTSLQIIVLESTENNEILVVANTHLYFHPDADHIRLLQAGISKIYLEEVVTDFCNKQPDKRISLLYCGDFNSVPECGIYKLFTTGFIPENFVDWKSKENEAVEGVSFSQNRLLLSACGTPRYTNFTEAFRDCLDYIFYEKNNFIVTQIVPLPSLDDLTAHTAIPSIVMPSDHISLVADLEWT